MHAIGLRLTQNLEVEKYLCRHRTPSVYEQNYPAFPFIYYTVDFELFLEDSIPWHWHHEAEVVEVVTGSVVIRSSKGSCRLSAGEICYVNPSALHQIVPVNREEKVVLLMHLFLPELVYGSQGNAIDTRYVRPILECRDLDLLSLSNHSELSADLQRKLARARALYDSMNYGFEFDVRREISEGWKLFFQAAFTKIQQSRPSAYRSEKRIQKMLSFIQQNYASDLLLKDIADAAMVSERECFRCFQSILNITPTLYLQNYRIRMAARMLLETDLPIQTVSEKAGFHDVSYFGRVFRKTMHCSPSAFRKKHHSLTATGEENSQP